MSGRRGSSTRGGSRAGGARAVVTGGAGFIGSHLVDRLAADGTAVLVIDDLSTGRPERVPPGVELERSDITRADLDRLMRAWRPTVVFHLAAQASVPASIADPLHDLAINVVGTHRVAEAARAARARRLVFVSSGGAVYGETSRPATETTTPAPTSYYGVHKLAAEGHVALARIGFAIVRPANVYGPRQGAGLEGAVVAAFLDQAVRTATLHVHGDGRQTRDFVHVDDVVEAIVQLGGADAPTGTWNVAAGRSISILELADVVESAVGRPLGRTFGPARAGDVRHSAISPARLRRLGWRPSIRLEAGIARLVDDRSVD